MDKDSSDWGKELTITKYLRPGGLKTIGVLFPISEAQNAEKETTEHLVTVEGHFLVHRWHLLVISSCSERTMVFLAP